MSSLTAEGLKKTQPGPKSKELFARKERAVPNAVTSLAKFMVAESSGAIIKDVDGNEYIDFTGGWGCLIVGHSHPKVVSAIKDQADRFVHTDFSVVMYEPYIELAERISKYAPGPRPKKAVFFNSGADAVENAVKIARYHTKRRAVVVFDKGFHGRTLLTMTMTHKASPYKAHFGPFASDVYRMPFPNPYHTPMKFAEWERLLVNTVAPDEIAAIVYEPVQGEGGFIVPVEDFVPGLRSFCDKHGIVMVADEVQTSMGRTGKMFASEHFGVEPDLICVAKSFASGMPLSAIIGVTEVIDSVGDSGIGGTYVGNPICCAAGVAVLDVIEDENLIDRANILGEILRARFDDFAAKYKIVGSSRGLGAMRAIELVKDRETKEPASEATAQVISEALSHGLVLAKAGLYGNVIRMLIPLVITEEQLNHGLDILDHLLAKVSG